MRDEMRSVLHWMAALGLVAMVTACGGGGGGSDDGPGADPDCTGYGPVGEDCGEDVLTSYTLDLGVTNSDGQESNELPYDGIHTLRVEVITDDRFEDPVEGAVVSASSDMPVVFADDGTALTDASGIAVLEFDAGDAVGAGSLTIAVDSPAGTVEETVNIRITRATATARIGSFDGTVFQEGMIKLNASSVSSRGSALLTVAVVDADGERLTRSVDLVVRSDCQNAGVSELPREVTLAEGIGEIEYTATGCEGDDAISATIKGTNQQATASLEVAPAFADLVDFVSLTPDDGYVALRGTGSADRPETARVRFLVMSGTNGSPDSGEPLEGVTVNFDLSTVIGGARLTNASAVSDEDGLVEAQVEAGTIAASTRVTASFTSSDGRGGQILVSTISDPVVISTGLPDQNSFSVSADVLNVQGAPEYDGLEAEITVRMADKFNNPVADGSVATFTTEYGSIQSSCSTVGGTCAVTWTSQDPRAPVFNTDLVRTIFDNDYSCPEHKASFGPCPSDLGAIRGGRNTILVTALGEETFTDVNGNGLYDRGEPFENLGEAFVDHNEDGVYTPVQGPSCPPPTTNEQCRLAGSEETFVDLDGNHEFSNGRDNGEGPNGWYNGSLCPAEGDGVYCSRDLVNVRDSIVLIMSSESDYSVIVVDDQTGQKVDKVVEGSRYTAYTSDRFNNRPSAQSIIGYEATGDCEALTPTGARVPDSNAVGAVSFPIQVKGDGDTGSIVVGVETPGGVISIALDCETTAPPPEADATDDIIECDDGSFVVSPQTCPAT